MDYKKEAFDAVNAGSFDKLSLVDITTLSIPGGEAKETAVAFLQGIKNPYLFRVGDIGVHVVFSGKAGDTLQHHICNLLSTNL